jgi:hypothetical protein
MLLLLIIIITTLVTFLLFLSSQNDAMYFDFIHKMKVRNDEEINLNLYRAEEDECKNFISNFKDICVCKNVIHAMCRDIDPKYIPQNDDEKRCVEYLKKFKGDICNCMNNFHGICQISESMTPV